MNSLKEVKPLIEWENYLGVWMVDLLPKDHLVEYTKMEAFAKIGVSNVRDWSVRESNLYNQLCCNNGILYLEHKEYNVIDNRKRPLIEWEREFGYCIVNLPNYKHLEYCTKEEASNKLYGNYLVQSWNSFADNLYCKYMNDFSNFKKINNEKIVVKDFEYVDVLPINDIGESVKVNVGNSKKRNSVLSKIAIIKNKLSEKIEKKIIKVNNKKNKVKVTNSGIKAFLSLTLSLVSTVSMHGFCKTNISYENSIPRLSYVNEIDDDVINLNHNNVFSSYHREIIKEEKLNIDDFDKMLLKKIIKDEIKLDFVENKLINELNKITIDNIKKEDEDINNDSLLSSGCDDVSIDDKIILEEGSKVYENIYSAIDEANGLSTYFSYDTCRNVDYIALDYNGNIIYSNDDNEVKYYKSRGAKVVSIRTNDGFYNVNDIVKVKTKKI